MRALAATIVAVLLAAGPTVHADTSADEAAALVHLDRGVAAFEAGDFVRARRELLAAHDLAPDRPNPYRWLALTDVQLGDCAQAIEHIDGFAARVTPDDPRLAEMVRLRELCARTGVLRVESTPTGASLRLDGALVGTTPYRSLSMRAGAHELAAEKPGFATATRSVIVPAGGELAVQLRLAAPRTPITGRWWFWTAVIGTAALATTAVLVIANDPEATLLPPVQCDGTGCRPGGT